MALNQNKYSYERKATDHSQKGNSSAYDHGNQIDLLNLPLWEPPLVRGVHKYIVGSLIKFHILLIALRQYLNPFSVYKVFKSLRNLQRQYIGDHKIVKLFQIQGRYYWDMHAPGWPSKAFVKYNEGEMNRIIQFRPIHDYLNSMIFAITKKCPLNCEHCYEWEVINNREKLTRDDLVSVVNKFQQRGKGVAQIQFSGGEPLSRYEDILHVLQKAKKDTDFWIVSSGYFLTLEKAKALKNAGLKGFSISLDHFDGNIHNTFRGSNESYSRVMTAIENAHQAHLVVILSLCVTRQFVSKVNLIKYANLAKRLGVSFILLIEPRAVGRYAGKDIGLSREQEELLEDFYLKLNFDKTYSGYPAVSYHGYHQRRVGCFGGTNRYVYVNTDGDLQVCPFCQKSFGNVVSDFEQLRTALRMNNGCKPYKQAVV